MARGIDDTRLHMRNDFEIASNGRYVLAVIDRALRGEQNAALDYAVELANQEDCSVLAALVLDAGDPDINARQWAFKLGCLPELKATCHERKIKLIGLLGAPKDVLAGYVEKAKAVVLDYGYLRAQKSWRRDLSSMAACRVVEIETNIIVPVTTGSDKQEYMAQHLRKKVMERKDDFLFKSNDPVPKISSLPLRATGDVNLSRGCALADEMGIALDETGLRRFSPGRAAGLDRLQRFIREGLSGYAENRTDPAEAPGSEISPYLHHGCLSPHEVVRTVEQDDGGSQDDCAAFVEEVLVRRELAINFVFYNANYDRYSGLPEWARATLDDHEDDARPQRYTRRQLEAAETDDPYWNAAMTEMRHTGFMHNYMRMYWGKQILAWCNTPAYAYRVALDLNNSYFLDGNDANSYANVGWLFGLHDRPWKEREVFGSVRPMTRSGLTRKFDMDEYVERVKDLSSHGAGNRPA